MKTKFNYADNGNVKMDAGNHLKNRKGFNFLILLLILTPLLLANQCKKEDLDTLPPETQEGKNTFGCLINGEVFVKGNAPWMHPRINAGYSRTQETLSLGAWLNPNGYMRLDIQNPVIGEQNIVYLCSYCSTDLNNNDVLCFVGKNISNITLTHFDTVGLVVSGRFSFDGQCSNHEIIPIGDSIIHVTDGRFDIKLNVYN